MLSSEDQTNDSNETKEDEMVKSFIQGQVTGEKSLNPTSEL
jgi:hypothetical protein